MLLRPFKSSCAGLEQDVLHCFVVRRFLGSAVIALSSASKRAHAWCAQFGQLEGDRMSFVRRFASTITLATVLLSSLFAQTPQPSSQSTQQQQQQKSQPKCTDTGTYVNSQGQTVKRPENCSTVPQGATAQCQDGSYSFSQNRRGTCSHHGGVAKWL